MINRGVNQRTKTGLWLWDRLKGCFLPPLRRISGSTTWIWRKPTRNKGPTGGWNISWRRLLDWLTCGHTACCCWAGPSCCRAAKPSTCTSATSWSATTAASSVTATVRSTRCAPCSTWTSRPTPNASQVGYNEPFLSFLNLIFPCWDAECRASLLSLSIFLNQLLKRYFLVSKC